MCCPCGWRRHSVAGNVSENEKTVAQHLHKKPSEVLPAAIAKIVTKNLRTVLTTRKPLTFEYEATHDDTEHSKRWWKSTYYPIPLGNNEYAIGALVQDINEQKLTERRKDDFISMASHELKTPVTTIKAFTQILQHIPNIQEEKAKDHLRKISSEVTRLTKLINDFLDVSKIRTGRLHIIKEPFEFDELVQETLMTYEVLRHDFKITTSGKTNKIIQADRSRVAQVIRNLLDNAIKYSADSKEMEITLSATDTTVTFALQDHGIGISKENQTKIFESFYRAFESEKVDYPGLGIGLYISAEIIKAHAGTIHVKSKKGAGALFYFTLPIEK